MAGIGELAIQAVVGEDIVGVELVASVETREVDKAKLTVDVKMATVGEAYGEDTRTTES